MGKIVLLGLLAWLLWDKLGVFRAHWRTILPAALGGAIGLANTGFLRELGAMREFREVGISPTLVTAALVVAWVLFVIAKARPSLDRLFPPERSRPDGPRGPRN